jgi:hypothetical protein
MRELIPRLAPEVLVVTGDLTHRGRRPELELAREVLESLDLPPRGAGQPRHSLCLPDALHADSCGVGTCLRNGRARLHVRTACDRRAELGPSVASAGRGGRRSPARQPVVEARACPGGGTTGGGAASSPCFATLARRPQTPSPPARSRPPAPRVCGSRARSRRPRPSELCRRAARVRGGRARSTSLARARDSARLRATETAAPWRGSRVQRLRVRSGEHHRGHLVVVWPQVRRGRSASIRTRLELAHSSVS